MRGQAIGDTLAPATDGFISNGAFSYSGTAVVEAFRQFQNPVQRVGAVGRWSRIGAKPDETTVSMAITQNFFSDMVHFSSTRDHWDVSIRRGNGEFVYIADGTYNPPLELERDYRFQLESYNGAITVETPGFQVTKNAVGPVGTKALWEEFAKPTELPVGIVFNYDTVWAAEKGQRLTSVPSNN